MKIASTLFAAATIAFTSRAAFPQTQPAPAITPFTGLPAPPVRPPSNSPRVHPGTPGLPLNTPAAQTSPSRTTIAILGDLSPANSAKREALLKLSVDQINLLRPEAILTTGNLIPGLTRNPTRYLNDLSAARTTLDQLNRPWFPCVGTADVVSGTRLPGSDRRFEELYRSYIAPLYFSVDIGGRTGPAEAGGGGVHAIVLDSEEGVGSGNTLGDAQLQWLRQDLNRTFDGGRAQSILLVMHRPLWREEARGSNWKKVHDLLVEFNRRPVTAVEGLGPPGGEARGARIMGVFAGAERAYSQDPPRDGIRYFVLGPTAAEPKPGETDALQHFTLVKFDNADMHVALIRLAGTAPAILPDDIINARERATLGAIAAWTPATVGITGTIDERGEPISPASLPRRLTFHAANPLADPIDVQLRIAPGSNWDFVTPPLQRRLLPSASAAYEFSLRRIKAGIDRPQLQAAIFWTDPRNRRHEISLDLPVCVSPAIDLTPTDKPFALDATDGWLPAGIASSFGAPIDPIKKPDPTIELAADPEHLLVRVHVTDGTQTYWPSLKITPANGGIASDAVSISFLHDDRTQRLWLLPFAPKGPELWTNSGPVTEQTELQRIDPKWPIQYAAKSDASGYTVIISLPRKLISLDAPATQTSLRTPLTTQLNVIVHDNDEGAQTSTKSWANENSDPVAWARVQLIAPPPPATAPLSLPTLPSLPNIFHLP